MYESEKKNFKKIALGILALILLITFIGSFGTISAGEIGVKTRLGQVAGTYTPGLYFKAPFIEKMNIVDVKVKTVDYDKNGKEGDALDTSSLSASSKDLQVVTANIVVNYSVNPANAVDVYTKYRTAEQFGFNVIEPLIRETVKAVTAEYTAEELVTKRAVISERVYAVLSEKFPATGVILVQSNLTNFDFSKSFNDAIESKVTAVQEAEAAKNQLETVKYEAQKTIEVARAEAQALEIKSKAVSAQGGAEYVKLQELKYWNGSKCTSYCYGIDAPIPAQIMDNDDR